MRAKNSIDQVGISNPRAGIYYHYVRTGCSSSKLVSRITSCMKQRMSDEKLEDVLVLTITVNKSSTLCIYFVSTDLYTFDETVEDAMKTYQLVCQSYEKLLKHLNLPILKGW